MSRKREPVAIKTDTKNKVIARLKAPWVMLGLAGLIYSAMQQAGIQIPNETFRLIVDIVAYVLMGVGVYKSYGSEEV